MSIPGVLTGRSVKLFSGQVIPVIEINNTRGLYGWKVNTLVNAAIASVQAEATEGASHVGMSIYTHEALWAEKGKDR